jgi:hypothetical protein
MPQPSTLTNSERLGPLLEQGVLGSLLGLGTSGGVYGRGQGASVVDLSSLRGRLDSQGAGATFFPLAALGYSHPNVSVE